MSHIEIKMRDGTQRVFKHEGRAGGSYTKRLRYEAGVAIVEDEWGKETVIPLDLIDEIHSGLRIVGIPVAQRLADDGRRCAGDDAMKGPAGADLQVTPPGARRR